MVVSNDEESIQESETNQAEGQIDPGDNENGHIDQTVENTEAATDYTDVNAEKWRVEYYQNCPTYVIHVNQPIAVYKNAPNDVYGHDLSDKSPLILIDSGESLSVAGKKWMQW